MIIQKNKLVWNSKPYIMGVVNVTPDSFSGDGIMKNNEDFVNLGVEKALGMQKDGADIIDVGGESTRPKHIYQGAQSISVDEELERVLPLLEKLKNNLAIPISIDTQKGIVAKYGLQYGAKIINDVSMMNDDLMAETLIKYKPIYILSHYRKTKHSTDIINDIYLDLEEKIQFLLSKNFPLENIIIDPVITGSEIEFDNSDYNGEYGITIGSTTSFKYSIPNLPEKASYTSTSSDLNIILLLKLHLVLLINLKLLMKDKIIILFQVFLILLLK